MSFSFCRKFDIKDEKKFTIPTSSQIIIWKLTEKLLDNQYAKFGKTAESCDKYNLVFPSSFKSSRRKPVTSEFQKYGETIFWPIIMTLLFGKKGKKLVEKYLLSFKVNTLSTSTYEGLYHMHLDHKIGIDNGKNKNIRKISRLLFSIIPDALKYGKPIGATVYPIIQPISGFDKIKDFHEYMKCTYPEEGLKIGNPRPLYKIPGSLLCRAETGDVMIHNSHGTREECQNIHAESNPCPERYLFVVDMKNICHTDSDGKFITCFEIPVREIISYMAKIDTEERLVEVNEIASNVLQGSILDEIKILLDVKK